MYPQYGEVNFGPLAAEIVSLVWGTPGNFNGFRIFAALLHGTLVVNRGRHLYSAGRPSRWALAHISSWLRFATDFREKLETFTTDACGVCLLRVVWEQKNLKRGETENEGGNLEAKLHAFAGHQ